MVTECNDEKIAIEVMAIVDRLGIDWMPSKALLDREFGTTTLSKKVNYSHGNKGWGVRLGLKTMKLGERLAAEKRFNAARENLDNKKRMHKFVDHDRRERNLEEEKLQKKNNVPAEVEVRAMTDEDYKKFNGIKNEYIPSGLMIKGKKLDGGCWCAMNIEKAVNLLRSGWSLERISQRFRIELNRVEKTFKIKGLI